MAPPKPPQKAVVGPPAPDEAPKPLHMRLLKFLCGHVGLFILVSAVAALGALLFIKIEIGAEEQRYLLKRNKAKDMQDGVNYFISYWWHFATKPNLTYVEWERKVKSNLGIMEQFVIDAVGEYGYDGTVDGWAYDWTFSKALLFTITIMTTIGYGHIYPHTSKGQFVTILYALVGTPMMLVFLAQIGDCMASGLTYTYSSRYQSERTPGKKVKRLAEDNVGKEPYMPTDDVQVPIVLNLVMIMVYLAIGASIFSTWEGWEFSGAYYFSFVTLSTIGFGDMVPGNSFLDKKDKGFVASVKMGVTILYCVVGMALISMCIQVMQEQILSKVRWMARSAGIIAEENVRPRVRVRKTRNGTAPETKYKDDSSRPVTAEKKKRRRRKKREEAESAQTQRSAPPADPPTKADDEDLLFKMSDSDDDLFNLA